MQLKSPDQDNLNPIKDLISSGASTTPLDEGDRLKTFYAGAAFEIGLVAVAMAIAALFPAPLGGEATINWMLSPSVWAQGVAWAAVMLGVLGGLVFFVDIAPFREIRAITRQLAKTLFVGRSWAELALFCCCAGIGEEVLFRGVLQPRIDGLLGVVPGTAALAVGFGLGHAITPAYAALSAGASAVFSYELFSSGNNLAVPVIAHSLYDFVAVQAILWELRRDAAAAAAAASQPPPPSQPPSPPPP